MSENSIKPVPDIDSGYYSFIDAEDEVDKAINILIWDYLTEYCDVPVESIDGCYQTMTEEYKIKLFEKYSKENTAIANLSITKDIQTLIGQVKEYKKSYSVSNCEFTRINGEEERHLSSKILETAEHIKQEILLQKVYTASFEKDVVYTGQSCPPPIVWNGKQADLARIYKGLRDAGLIKITGRDFSKHFVKENGDPMPEDFTESQGTNQDKYSPRQDVLTIQRAVRGMKVESGE